MVKIKLLFFLFFPFLIFAQTGPGGVGNSTSNMLWLKADANAYSDAGTTLSTDGTTVQQWNDKSGNLTNASQGTSGSRPTYKTNIINGKPVLRFDGTDDWLGVTINVPETNFSQFIVFQTIGSDGAGSAITITDPVSSTAGSHDRQFGLTGNKLGHRLWNNQVISSASNYNDNAFHIADIHVNSSSGQTIYAEGTSVATGNKTSSDFNWQTGMVIGGHSAWGYLNCDISEVIFYNILLNNAQRIIVQNYLSSKYGIAFTTASNDKYSYDAAHSNDVAGIGRVDASNTHTDAQSGSILQINTASSLGDGDYLLFGHDDGSISSWTTTEAPNSGTDIKRITREWRLDETDGGGGDGVGTVKFVIDTTLLPARTSGYTKYVLMVDADGDFSSGASVYEMSSPSSDNYFETASAITINDGDYVSIGEVRPTVGFSVSASSGFETTNATITVTLNYIAKTAASVTYNTANGTAAAPGDYTAVAGGTATIAAGSSSIDITITVINDVVVENDETFTVTISAPSAGINLGSITTHTYTIHDDDNSRKIYFTAASSSGNENVTPVTLTVTIDVGQIDATNPTTVDYSVSGGTATGGGTDFTLAAGTATIAANTQTTTISLTIIDDVLYEASETVIVSLSNPTNGNLSSTDPIDYTYTITDNDTPPVIQFSSTSSNGIESVTSVNFQADLSTTSALDATVSYTISGTATGSGTDYTLSNGTLTIPAGSTSANISATIIDDGNVELSETIIITLSGPINSTLGANTIHTYTIIDNDVFGYEGPGGIGKSTNNLLWLKADANAYSDAGTTLATDGSGVQQWNDQSGNANTMSQGTSANRPVYKTNILNGKPVLRFDGSNDWMGLNIDVPETGFSQFVVLKTNSSDGAGAAITITDAVSSTAGSHDRQFGLSGNKMGHRLWNNQVITSASNFNDNAAHITSIDVNSSTGQTLYADGSSVATGNKTSSDFNWQTSMVIGGHTGWGFLNCDMAEIIFYNTNLNTAQRIIVENYLAAKYGLSILAASDKFAYDATYGTEVAGIGMEDASNYHTDAKGSGIVRINSASSLATGDYFLWGHDNGLLAANEVTDIPASEGVEARLVRSWRVSETGEIGTVNISFDLTGLGVITASDLRLLIDKTNNGFADETVAAGTIISGATSLGSNVYEFSGVNIDDSWRFSLGTVNSSDTPLPVELIDFSAIGKINSVLLEWSTATETNNDYFSVEKSKDGINFEFVADIDGAGNSTSVLKYSLMDNNPYEGISYYRLKQTDYDGKYAHSNIVAVDLNDTEEFKFEVFPNPGSGDNINLAITAVKGEEVLVVVYDMNGKESYTKVVIVETEGENVYAVDLSNKLAPGIYMITATSQQNVYWKKLIVR